MYDRPPRCSRLQLGKKLTRYYAVHVCQCSLAYQYYTCICTYIVRMYCTVYLQVHSTNCVSLTFLARLLLIALT